MIIYAVNFGFSNLNRPLFNFNATTFKFKSATLVHPKTLNCTIANALRSNISRPKNMLEF